MTVVGGGEIEPDNLDEQQLRELLRRQHRAWTISGYLLYELIQEPSNRRGFGRTGVDVNQRRQHVCEKAPAVGIQRDVSANGQEVLAISDSPDVVRRLREQRETVDPRCLQVGREHVRPLGRHHEYVSRSKTVRRTLAVDGEPAVALHDRGQLNLLRRRKVERPGPSCL